MDIIINFIIFIGFLLVIQLLSNFNHYLWIRNITNRKYNTPIINGILTKVSRNELDEEKEIILEEKEFDLLVDELYGMFDTKDLSKDIQEIKDKGELGFPFNPLLKIIK